MHTYQSALTLIGVGVPAHLDAAAQVPVLTGPQAQGDLLVVPEMPPASSGRRALDLSSWPEWERLPAAGVQVVRGEASGNSHWLHAGFASPGVRWWRTGQHLVHGYVLVPAGQSALLIHTDEHGANGIGQGIYAVRGKRELTLAVQPLERLVID
jgi:hypothetical protein